MESNTSRLITVDDKRPSSPAAVLAALGGPGQKSALLQAWQTPDWQTGGVVNRMDALCATVADAVKAIGLHDGHLVVVPTADVIGRNCAVRPTCDATLAELYNRMWNTHDRIETLFRAMELGDRALHMAGGWVGGSHHADVIRNNTPYVEAMGIRGYGTARTIAKHNPGNATIQAITRFLPEIMRHFQKIVEVLRALGKGITNFNANHEVIRAS